jgi:hypothetical protein
MLPQGDDIPTQQGNNIKSQNQEYYPRVNKDERALHYEQSLKNALRGQREFNPKIYPADPNPYYGRERPKRFRSDLLKDTVSVDIDLADLSYTFPSTKNLRRLEAELERLQTESKRTNAYGKKLSDADESYYDPTRQGREARIQILKKRIAQMDYDLSHNFKPDISFEKENVNPNVQNPTNADREGSNQFVADSYFYPVDKKKLANGKIEEGVLSKHGLLEKSKYIDNDKKIEATADSIGEILGNKYVNEEVKKLQSQSKQNVDTPQQPGKEKFYYINDGTLTLRNGAQTQKIKDKDGKDCDKEKFIDANKIILNSIGKEIASSQKLFARKENENANANTTNESNQNNLKENKSSTNIANSNSSVNFAVNSAVNIATTKSNTEASINSTPATTQNASNNPKSSEKVEVNPTANANNSANDSKKK